MSLNLATLLTSSASKYPDKAAVVIGETSVTYRQLLGLAQGFASVLNGALGVAAGSNIALMLPNVPQFTATYYGSLFHGSTAVPLNVLLKSQEVRYHLDNSNAKVLVVWEGFLQHAQNGFDQVEGCRHLIVVPQDPTNTNEYEGDAIHNWNVLLQNSSPGPSEMAMTSPGDTAVILYTSGTTGSPKGAELSHFNLFQNAQSVSRTLLGMKSRHKLLAVLPLFHTFCQTVVQNCALAVGATIVLMPRFDAEGALGLMQKHEINIFAGVPTMYFALLHYPKASDYKIDSLEYCLCGGSAMPESVMREFDKRYNVNVLEGYGLSETSPVASFNVLDRPKKVGSIGVPIDFVEFSLVDDEGKVITKPHERGEIHIRGVNVMKGYYQAPEANAKAFSRGNGWFATGDIGTFDEDGYYFIVDRKKDMIIRGGYNVYSREVEEVLYSHDGITEAAVIGIPDERLGEEVKAVVVLNPDSQATPEDIIEFCKANIASYKYPRVVEVVEALPKSATGKILKRELRD